MASTTTFSPLLLAQAPSFHRTARNARPPSCKAHASPSFATRRQLLFVITAAPAFAVRESVSALAQDIPLFGLKKKLKKVEEEAEVLVREGFEAAEKGLDTAEKGIETVERGIETAERGIETAEKEIEEAVSFGGLAQAAVVAGAEFVAVLVATSVVNGILGAEGQKS